MNAETLIHKAFYNIFHQIIKKYKIMIPQKMNIETAKQTDLKEFLERVIKMRPTKEAGNDCWYYSPFRQEKTPSFKINRKLGVWYDHGLGKGGNIIDFGVLFYNCTVTQFLEKLNNHAQFFSFHQQDKNLNENKRMSMDMHGNERNKKEINGNEREQMKMKVLEIKDLQDGKLKQYFEQRGIYSLNTHRYCKEILIEIGGKQFPVIGFKNQSGGYELRGVTHDFKSTIPPKDFSFFSEERSAVAVVEGMFDFLSLLEKRDFILPELTNFLILNSLSFFEKALPTMDKHERVYLLLDNDTAGKNCAAMALKLSPKYHDLSNHYAKHKDLNEWLVKEKKLERQEQQKQEQQPTYRRGLRR